MAFDIYGARHPLMRVTDTIDIVGVNGDRVRISGIGMRQDWGPQLAPASTGLFEPPFKSNWGPGMFGQQFASWSPLRRDVVFTVHIMNPEAGIPALDFDPDLWHTIYSRWRAMWSPEHESTIIYGSVDGERRLRVRLLEEPRPFQTQRFEGGDPHLFPYGSIVMAVAAEIPYYVGPTERYVFDSEGLQGNFWFTLPYFNPASVAIWPEWYVTDRALYVMPDYSFGNEEYGRGLADMGKTVSVTPIGPLLEGENCDIKTRPDQETIKAENDAPVGNRMRGQDFEYPIPPGAGSTTDGCVIRVLQCTNPDGARVELDLPRWYNEPFSTPLVA